MTGGTSKVCCAVSGIRAVRLLSIVLFISGASRWPAASAASLPDLEGAASESSADGTVRQQQQRRELQAVAAADQHSGKASSSHARRRLQKTHHDHTPAYRANFLKPHAHTPTYYAKKTAGQAEAEAAPRSPPAAAPTHAVAKKPPPPPLRKPPPPKRMPLPARRKPPPPKRRSHPPPKHHPPPPRHHPPPPKLTPREKAAAKARAAAAKIRAAKLAAAKLAARKKAYAKYLAEQKAAKAAAAAKYIAEEKAALLAAAIARVTYPTPVPAPTQYGGGAIQGQIPFRYNPLVGIPPRIRTGYYYLPSGWQNTALPVMVLFHGLEGYGLSIMYAGTPNQGDQSTFQDNAEQYKFILIAPDSQSADLDGWHVPLANEAPTPDVLHTQACLEYVRNLPNVVFNTRFIGAAGVSNGGFMATPIASRYSIYTHSMNMHDTFFVQQVMNNVHKIWFSTGVFDPEYPPSKILALVKLFEGTRPTWPKIAYNLQFLIPHTLGDPLERTDTIRWWLGLGNYEQFMSLAQLRAIGSVG